MLKFARINSTILIIVLILLLSNLCWQQTIQPESGIHSTVADAFEVNDPSVYASKIGTIAINFNATNVFWRNWEQKTFHAQGLFWAFYGNGSREVYSTSKDGYLWASPSVADNQDINSISCSVWYNGESTIYNVVIGNYGSAILFKTGTLTIDGEVIWGNEVTVISEPSTAYFYPYISVDSAGYQWISYCKMTGGLAYPCVIKNLMNNGSWQTAAGFPYQLSSVASKVYYGQLILPLTNGKMFAFYVDTIIACGEDNHNTYGQAQTWTGSSWLQSTNTTAVLGGEMQGGWEWGLVPQGDNVHIVYLANGTDLVAYEKYSYDSNSFGPEQIISHSRVQAYTVPMLSLDESTGRLFAVWAGVIKPSGVVPGFYYSMYADNVWGEEHFLVDDSVYCNFICPYAASISLHTFDNYLCLIFVNGTAINYHDPMPVRFAFKDISNISFQVQSTVSPAQQNTASEQAISTNNSWILSVIVVTIGVAIVAVILIVVSKRKTIP